MLCSYKTLMLVDTKYSAPNLNPKIFSSQENILDYLASYTGEMHDFIFNWQIIDLPLGNRFKKIFKVNENSMVYYKICNLSKIAGGKQMILILNLYFIYVYIMDVRFIFLRKHIV